MSSSADRHREAFREEANELLAELETALLELEEFPGDAELVGRVFRAMHTIKGSGSMFGFDDVAAFTHEIETAFDLIRNGKMAVTKEIIDLTLAARDQIRAMISPSESTVVDVVRAGEIVAAFKGMLPGGSPKPGQGTAPAAAPADAAAESSAAPVTYRIRFKPIPSIFMTGTNPLTLLGELSRLGKCTVVAQTSGIPLLDEMDPELCHTSWNIILTTDRGINAIKDVFIFIEDAADVEVDRIDDGIHPDLDYKKLGEILIERGDITQEELSKVLASQKKIGELLVESGTVEPERIQTALVEQQHIREVRKEREASESIASVRVPSERLDKLVDLVGELVTVQARLSQTAAGEGNPRLLSIAEEVERLTEELRDNTMNIRMLPIGSTFTKFKRLVRDLSKELGKEIELTTEGAETELD
ncbi:MAG: Hpt domain-containing protein, partial [Nitrospirota bacterium]